MITTCWPSIGTLYITSSAWMPSGVHGRGASGTPMHELAEVHGMQTVGVLVGIDREQRGLAASRCSGSGTCMM